MTGQSGEDRGQSAGTNASFVNLAFDFGKFSSVYFTVDAEIEITNLNPSVKTKTRITFLKNMEPKVGNNVKVRYDPKDPKVAIVVT